ncbi:Hsp20/alpha crystallin family protein [Schlesneria sp.]|uniref:Hsp20/alpha crystallin family protein n=1 Tax=Schlesneria sp. TaxID=2762018 RepID=UPI002EDE2D40
MLVRTRRIGLPSVDSLSTVHRDMEELFGRLVNGAANGASAHGWHAPVTLWNDADKVYVEIEVPGVKKEDLEVTVHNGLLRIAGQRKAAEGERQYWTNERRFGAFERTMTIPDEIDADSIDAELVDGVLHLTLTKKPEAQPKRIAVK